VSADVTEYTDANLPLVFSATYRVYAVNPYGVSDFSFSVSLTVDGIPSDLNTSLASNGLRVEWVDNSLSEEFFIIERKLDESGSFDKIDSVTSNITEYTDTHLPPTFTASYRIYAIDLSDATEPSTSISTAIDGSPSDISISFVPEGIKVAWADNSISEEFFIIERKVDEGGSFVKIDSVSSNMTEFIDTDNIENEVVYRIYSKNELGISNYSDEKVVILGINEIEFSNMNVYPNPFKDSFFINVNSDNIEDYQVQVYNLKGKSIAYSLEHFSHDKVRVLIHGDSKIYLISINNGDEVMLIKMMKE
jgi:hypothetical protein